MPSTPVEQRRRLVTAIPGPAVAGAARAASRRRSPPASAIGLPVYVERAGGGILVDVDGNQLIDFGSGIAVTTVGNAAPRVVAARAASRSPTSPTPASWSRRTRGTSRSAEALNELTPGDAREALRAVQLRRRGGGERGQDRPHATPAGTAVVAFDHAYHGRTNLTMALTAKNMPYKHGFGPFAGEVYRAPMAYPFRWPGGAGALRRRGLRRVRRPWSHAQVGETNIAAVIIEPIQGEGGFIVPPRRASCRGVADWCAEHGIVLIADEIQTGFCRTGDWFACEHEGVVPDLITTAKGIAGGLPLAAVTGRAEIMDAVHTGGLGGTYGGNPVACAAALGAIETMRSRGPARRGAREIEALMRAAAASAAPRSTTSSATSAAAARCSPSSWSPARRPRRPNPALTAAVNAGLPRRGRWSR